MAEHNQEVIESLAKQPKTNTKTIQTLNMLTPIDLQQETFSKKIQELFNLNHFLNGQKGLAQFAVENLLTDENGNLQYVCSDPSRHTFRYKDLNGNLERDILAKNWHLRFPTTLRKNHQKSLYQIVQILIYFVH
jgi:hypothetical protein